MSQFLSRLEPLPKISNINVGQRLGQGAFAAVRLGELLGPPPNQLVAVKFIHRRSANSLGVSDDRIGYEIRIHKECSGHPNIINLFLSGTDNVWVYMVMELAGGGDLFDKIDPDVGLSPEISNFYFRQLINAVDYIHMKGVAHRDIKPENIFIDDGGNLKLGDFGLATVFRRHGSANVQLSYTPCGSGPYMAPEIVEKGGRGNCGYESTGVDIWACGAVLFVLLSGQIPWEAPLYQRDYNFTRYVDIVAEGSNIPDDPWTRFSPEILGLLRGIMKPDCTERFSMKQIRAHTWMNMDNIFMDKKGMCSDSQELAEELYSRLHVATSEDDLQFAMSSSYDRESSHFMPIGEPIDSIPDLCSSSALSSFGGGSDLSQKFTNSPHVSLARPSIRTDSQQQLQQAPSVSASPSRARATLPSISSYSQPANNYAVIIDDFSSELVFASQNPRADVAKLPSYNMQDEHERILAIVSKDPAVLQFRKTKKLTDKSKYQFSIKSMTRFFSTTPLESLVHMLLDAFHRLGVTSDSMENLRSEDMATQTELYIAVGISGGSSKFPVKGYIHITRPDSATNFKQVEFVKLKGDPLEWRNFFKKVTLLCRDAVYIDQEI